MPLSFPRRRSAGPFAVAVLCAACAGNSGAAQTPTPPPDASPAALVAVPAFGTNPAGLRMYEYVPAGAPSPAPLVLVLHGCSQTAADIAATGWNALADRGGFDVVYAEQTAANNALLCFNWFGGSSSIGRGVGENLSIKQMVDAMNTRHGIDPARVFVAGFSAGAAEALVMLSDWPDVFAAGAALSGVPYGCAGSALEATTCMNPGKDQTAAAWGALVRAADTGFASPYPRVSLWQGTSDTTVNPANLAEEVKQWTDVLGAPATATATDTLGGFPHQTFADSSGRALVESYAITGMGHAVPVDPASDCGTAGAFATDVKVCAAKEVAAFFGLISR
ncbi:MAG TPA: PHB depolymerase family esterase [Polyangiaceae bacterium]|jgi:poly(hydroxyalkanoate) depolymerase family esterase